MDREIVMASEEDREELLLLYKAQLGRDCCPWDEDYPSYATIDGDLSRSDLFVLKRNGRILAAVSIEEDTELDELGCWDLTLAPEGELARLAVLPEEQGRGFGRTMLRFGMEELKRRGCRGVRFLVNRDNAKAIASYAPFGFRIVGKCHMYEQDLLCYEKALADSVK